MSEASASELAAARETRLALEHDAKDARNAHARSVEVMEARHFALSAKLSEVERVHAVTSETTAEAQALAVAQLNIRVAERDAAIEGEFIYR